MNSKELLDKLQHIGIYVVDRETLTIYYENPIAEKYTGRNRMGEPCYEVHGNTSMCSTCPIRRKEHISYVNRPDCNMVFAVRCEEITWENHAAYLVFVVKQADTSKLSGNEKSMKRMSHALKKVVDIYTEINLSDGEYKQINLHDYAGFRQNSEGNYPTAFEYMCQNIIYPEDVELVKKNLSFDTLKKVASDSEGAEEIVVRYKMRNQGSLRVMECRAIFMRDELPHYVVCLTKDITEEFMIENHAHDLEEILSSVACGVQIYELDENRNITTEYMNDGVYRLLECSKNELSGKNTELVKYIHPDYRGKVASAFHRVMDGEKTTNVTYISKTYKGNIKWIKATFTASYKKNGGMRICGTYVDCTESKDQQSQLAQNQRAVELAQTQGGLSIWTYNIDKGIILQQTPVDVEGHMGYPVNIPNVPECFVENGCIHPDDVEKYVDAYNRLTNGEETADVIYRLYDQTKHNFSWVHMFYKVMENNLNGDRMAVGFSLDANKQQEAIERYETEQKLREQIYANAVMYIEYNLMTGKFEGKNNLPVSFQRLRWEFSNVAEYRDNMKSIVEDCYLDTVVETLYSKNLLHAFQNGERKVTCEFRSKQVSGMQSNWYRATAVMVDRPDTGDIVAFIYIHDIEEEKLRQLALHCSMRDGMESIVIINGADGHARLVRTNHIGIADNVGNSITYDESFIKHSQVKVVEEEKESSFHAALLSTVLEKLETQDIYQYSVSILGTDGSIKRRLFRYRYIDDRKIDIVLSISDITSVYLEEQEKKKQLENALLEVRKASQAKAGFYSRMSHDMRTPMNGILGMTVLSEDETDVDTLKANMDKIQESGKYLLNLINDTLDIQRIESGKMVLEPKIVRTTDVVSNVLDMVRVTAEEKGVNLKYNAGNADLNWYIRADDLRLKQIFVNLLSNAIKFTPAGGTVELEFKLLSREGMLSRDVIYVRDTGVGMSEEFLKNRIFKPFSQESNVVSTAYAGSGLGLSIAKSLVELMHGKIEVESELGAGTTFAVYLEFERVDDAEVEKVRKNRKIEKENLSYYLNGKKILLAEDHPLNAEIARKLLEKMGCEVVWAKNGQEAVSCFAKSSVYTYDAILMDIRMPEMDGLDATRKIRSLEKEDAPTIPIIAMTANAYEGDAKACLQAGMNAHLGKPIVPKDLYAVLAECFEK